MTQKAKLIEILKNNEWVCSTDFQANYVPEFRSLISHLNKHEGFVITDELCLGKCGKKHESRGLKRWKLVSMPDGKCCVSFGIFGSHARDCMKSKELVTPGLF